MSELTIDSFKKFKEVIRIINNLRDLGVESEVKLPKIVVIGIQSSGKSSLIEQIVQIDFLPRGTGVVTRCPLEIRLIQEEEEIQPYAYFFDEKNKIYKNFEDVKKRIEEITRQKAGQGKNIVDETIVLQIFQRKCPTLTLIDLPGMTQNSTDDQLSDIKKVTENMTRKYIEDEKTIILCVIPINHDLENSLALQLARSVDSKGDRTIGVLTMIDIMNPGTNCKEVLNNNLISLKHRYYGMKPRNQCDINNNISVEKAILNEIQFFENSQDYSEFSEYTGTKALTQKLSNLLDNQIREYLPSIYTDIQKAIVVKTTQNAKLGQPFPTDINKQRNYLSVLINKTVDLYNSIMASPDHHLESKVPSNLRINNRFGKHYIDYCMDRFYTTCQEQMNQILIDYKLQQVEEELQRFRIPVNGFIPFEALESKLRVSISKMEQKSLEMLQNVKDYMRQLIQYCIEQSAYPNQPIKRKVMQVAKSVISRHFKFTLQHLETNFKCLKDCIYSRSIDIYSIETKTKSTSILNQWSQPSTVFDLLSKSKDFFTWTMSDIFQKIDTIKPNQVMKELEQNGVAVVDYFIQNKRADVLRYCFIFYKYVENLKNQISDQVPQFAQTLLTKPFGKEIGLSLIYEFVSNQSIQNLNELLQEDPSLNEQRIQVKQSLNSLKKAYQTLRELTNLPSDFIYDSQLSSDNEDEDNYTLCYEQLDE